MSVALVAFEHDVMTREEVFYLSCGCVVRAPREAQLMASDQNEWRRACEEMLAEHVCPGAVSHLLPGCELAALIGK